jgi:hypothetical protein
MVLACTLAMPGPRGAANAQPGIDIPQSVRMEHESVLAYLTMIAARKSATGKAAQKLLDVMKEHMAFEEAVVLPPLVLLPDISEGKITPDMRWAIALSDQVKAEQQGKLLRLHSAVTDAALVLQQAAEDEQDHVTVGFVRDLAADDLGDREITEPTVIMIGEVLRSKLPAK